MIFVDTNVFMYAVGRPHHLQSVAREFFVRSHRRQIPLCTSAEVLQELLHAYTAAERINTLEAAFSLVSRYGVQVWPLEPEDVMLAQQLVARFPTLSARDLCHLASCRRRGVKKIKTFDQTLRAVGRPKDG